ncbi:hypothetical protein MRX96_057026 [Rhipicephalus microplus]|uniref:uncharacterized protein LOC142767124 n=1 Tax=Rhipicephalus microplus TaxID=6941 RepID=UPI003F6BC07F
MRIIPMLEDRTLAASGSHDASFRPDDGLFMGTVDTPSRGDEPRRRVPSAYYVCMQRCTVAATLCLVVLAFSAVISGVSKKKGHHALFYIEVRHATERTEPTSTYVSVKGGARPRALDYDTTVRDDTTPLRYNATLHEDKEQAQTLEASSW